MRFELDEYLKELETLVNTDSGSRVEGGPGLIADYFEEKYRALGLDIKRVSAHSWKSGIRKKRQTYSSWDIWIRYFQKERLQSVLSASREIWHTAPV